MMPVQRLFAHAIARQQQALPGRIPQRQRKHAVEARQHRITPLLVTVHDHFGVAVGRETMAAFFQLGPQGAIVIDLAVVHDLDRAVFIPDRLIAARHVDDRQPPHRQPQAAVDEEPVAVRAAMNKGRVHALQQGTFDRRIS